MVHTNVNLSSLIASHLPRVMSTDPNDPDTLEYAGPKWWIYVSKRWPLISQPLGILWLFFLIWACARCLFPEYTYPDSVLVRMMLLFVGAQLCGILITFVNLPEMLGMIGFGIIYANVGWANFEGLSALETFLRELALVNIMLLAGLGIDVHALVKLLGVIFRLTVLPTLVEVVVISVMSVFILNMPWLWSILLGLMVTAVSPNVVVDILLRLRDESLGLYKGIHTIIITVTICSDVLSIFLFGLVLGMIFSSGSLKDQLLQGPVGIIIGIVYGIASGVVVCILPSNKSTYSNAIRFLMMVFGGIFSVLGSKYIGFPSAGALGSMLISCVAATHWKTKHNLDNDVAVKLNLLWKFVKPISFALIGKEVEFTKLDMRIVGCGIAIVLIASILRLLSSYASAYGADLSWKERAYVTISGFPKATVQAALAPVALDMVRKLKSEGNYEYANIVLIIGVIAIVLTAPIGAVLMVKFAPKWLKGPQSLNQPHRIDGETLPMH